MQLVERLSENVGAADMARLRVVVPASGELFSAELNERSGMQIGWTGASGVCLERLAVIDVRLREGGTVSAEEARLLGDFGRGLAKVGAGRREQERRRDPARLAGHRADLAGLALWAGAAGAPDAVVLAEAEAKFARQARAILEWALDGSHVQPERFRVLGELGKEALAGQGDEIVARLVGKEIGGDAAIRNGNLGHALWLMGLGDAQLGRLVDTGKAEWIVVVCDARRNRLGSELGERLQRELKRVRPGIVDPELSRRADMYLADLERDLAWRAAHPEGR